MQLGGGGDSHNPWAYDSDAIAIYRSLARLHNDLVPYLRLGALAASQDGTPPALALSLAFPDDPGARADAFSYLLGTDLLVAPVVDAGATTRHVHIPAGLWVHWFTGTAYTGPLDADIAAPLGQPVVLLRQGALVPLLASDVDTLVEASDATVTTAASRASIVRARMVPAGARSIHLEDHTQLGFDDSVAALALDFTPGTDGAELRALIDLAHAGSGMRVVSSVAFADGTPFTAAPDAASVDGGCDACWFHDSAAGTLHIAFRRAGRVFVH
jgi:hypothetical protein